MIEQEIVRSDEQMAIRTALAEVITSTARRVLAEQTDAQLLGQEQARWAALVKRTVRAALRAQHPKLLEQVSAWRLGQLLNNQVRDEVRKHQFAAFERELSAIYGPLEGSQAEEPLPISGPINGVYLVEVAAPSPEFVERDKAWSADD